VCEDCAEYQREIVELNKRLTLELEASRQLLELVGSMDKLLSQSGLTKK
jgi:hypothetical protein